MVTAKNKAVIVIFGTFAVVFCLLVVTILSSSSERLSESELKGKKFDLDADEKKEAVVNSVPVVDSHFEKQLVDDKYFLVKSDLTWSKFAEEMNNGNILFVEAFSGLFKDLSWDGVYFECKPFNTSMASVEKVEFRLIKTDAFSEADASSFADHFSTQCSDSLPNAAVFLNNDKTSTLVSPCPADGLDGAHMKSFMESGTLDQRKSLIQKLGQTILEKIKSSTDERIWLSTSGRGVPWLHMRFDPKPKYYNTEEYKN